MTTGMRSSFGLIICATLVCGTLVLPAAVGRSVGLGALAQAPSSTAPQGQTATPLGDGRWLLMGGEDSTGATAHIALFDPQTAITTQMNGSLAVPRAWHTSTVLPDGRILIVGGRHDNQIVDTPEIFDPAHGVSTLLAINGSVGRAAHTTTLLTDGRVLIAGGTNGGPGPVQTEIWDLQTQIATPIGAGNVARVGHGATLLADGRVLLSGGHNVDGRASTGSDIIDPQTLTRLAGDTPKFDTLTPVVADSIPANGMTDVALDTHLTLRFSDALRVDALTNATITLSMASESVPTKVVAAEGGRLAFVWPLAALAEDTTYTVSVSGPTDWAGVPVVPSSITFKTRNYTPKQTNSSDDEAWVPDEASVKTGWRTGRPQSPWELLAPLQAPPGVTAISGRVLTLDGRPLPDVTLAIDGDASTRSDRTGRFLLVIKPEGPARRVLKIDGHTANHGNRRYGFFEYGTTVTPGQTNVLPFTSWMPKLDRTHVVTIPSPTTSEIIVTTPYIPGLELHIPPATVIRGEDGKPVTEVGITPIPVDRPPFPLAKNVVVPVYFTVQPGSAYVQTSGAGLKGAWLVYPNYRHDSPGQRLQFFHYEPEVRGWYIYGMGTVTANADQVQPDATTRLYEFTGAMINDGEPSPAAGPTPATSPRADPVDPSTGIFSMHKTDLTLPDVIPLALTRTYNSGDTFARAFGRGMTHPYAMFLFSSQSQYTQADLILPEGGKIHYVRTSSGIGFTDAELTHVERPMDTPATSATPTTFYQSKITWNGNGWNLTLTDRTVYVFGENAPLQAIRDRYGNTVEITHANGQTGNITQVTSPNGRWIRFTYDTSNRITQAKDNIGRTVSYTYDANGNLETVTDPETNVTTYTYTAGNQLATIKDGRNIVYLTNEYTNGRVSRQTLADPEAIYQFSYTADASGNITQTDITDPRGHIERLAFNADHYTVSDTQAIGATEQRTITTERQPRSNLVMAVVDGLNRRTEYTYDGTGHVRTMTRLAGTLDAAMTTFTYEPQFNQLATITDPLLHTWTLGYDTLGRLTSATDPLTHVTTVAPNAAGQVTSATDALQHTTQFGYTGGDLTSITDPLNAVQRRFIDGAGRLISVTDPLGRQTRFTPDKLNRVTTVTDALGAQTDFDYDPNGNMRSLTDALNHANAYTYDTSDRVYTRTDPLQKVARFEYDKNNNLTQTTDRKGQVTTYQYDALDRRTLVTYAEASTTQFVYDAGDRVKQIIDSVSGRITREYDLLDRLTSETTPEGSVGYTYDADGRRATMTVSGQPQVIYGYDGAHRLTSIEQLTDHVMFTYDNANRRSTLTFPNGILATYSYDDANHLTSLAYTLNGNPVGDLTYTYDANGQRTSVGGTFARTGLPQALANVTYDAANRITTRDGQLFSYDPNGNLASDGLTSYAWNARNELVGLSGGASASFAYDAIGRRRSKVAGGTSTNFLFDGLNLAQELSGSTPTANLLTGLSIDQTFMRTDASGRSSLLTDALGSTLELTDASGTLQTHYTFEPFGTTTGSGAVSTNASQFTGRENDGTGLYFYRARFYSPALQRFISEDPLGFSSGPNIFAYTENAPTNATDPSGLFSCQYHTLITIGATGGTGIPLSYAQQLAQAVCDVDNGTQSTRPDDTHRHGMGGRKDNGKYESCDATHNGARDLLNDLIQDGQWADALHLIQDQWASGHRYQPWNPYNIIKDATHYIGDTLPSDYALNNAIEASKRFLNDVLNNHLGNADDYLHDFCK